MRQGLDAAMLGELMYRDPLKRVEREATRQAQVDKMAKQDSGSGIP